MFIFLFSFEIRGAAIATLISQCFRPSLTGSLFFALFRKVILLVPLALVLPAMMQSAMGIYLAEPISDATSAIVCGVTFFRFIKTLKDEPLSAE